MAVVNTMIEYKHKHNGIYWVRWPTNGMPVLLGHFDDHIIKINGEVFLDWTPKFVDAYAKEKIWRKLND